MRVEITITITGTHPDKPSAKISAEGSTAMEYTIPDISTASAKVAPHMGPLSAELIQDTLNNFQAQATAPLKATPKRPKRKTSGKPAGNVK